MNRTRMNQSGQNGWNRTKVDRIGLNRTEMDRIELNKKE